MESGSRPATVSTQRSNGGDRSSTPDKRHLLSSSSSSVSGDSNRPLSTSSISSVAASLPAHEAGALSYFTYYLFTHSSAHSLTHLIDIVFRVLSPAELARQDFALNGHRCRSNSHDFIIPRMVIAQFDV